MSVLGISEESQHILDGASQLAKSRHHTELDGIHLFYSLVKNSNAASSLSNLMGFVDQQELLSAQQAAKEIYVAEEIKQ